MSNIKRMKDKDGNYIYPVTHASAVFDSDGNNLLDFLVNAIIANGATNVGYVDVDNTLCVTGLPQGKYTLRYKGPYGPLDNYYDIGVIENGKITNKDLISENIPPYDATCIGVYDADNKEVGNIPLFYFKKERDERLYSFGILSDVHNQTNQGAESTADLQRALNLFNERETVEFTCITGDISENATEAEYQIYKNNVETCSPDTPVYATPGNHDCSGSGLNLELWRQYTGCERTYEIKHGNDHFIFLGMNKWSMGSASCIPYLVEDLDWLEAKIEEYKNERCFIFTHLFFPEYAGNFKEIYIRENWLMGTQHDRMKNLLNNYPNTIWFSGHSHWKWYLQKYEDNANVQRDGGWTVHIPSCASPIDSDGVSTRVSKGLESEGAIIDVYENYIEIRGIDLKNDKYIPVAKYRLDTTLTKVAGKTCDVEFKLTNATVSNNATSIDIHTPYTNTVIPDSEGITEITVTMDGEDITSSAVSGNEISIEDPTGKIVITVNVIVGFVMNLLDEYTVHMNNRWSASSNATSAMNGVLYLEVPFSVINGKTIKIIGFTPETGGVSTWYAYKDGSFKGRISDGSSGTIWTLTSLRDNNDGSYDVDVSKEIFCTRGTTTPITSEPDTIKITMKVSDSMITSLNGLYLLVSE